ncbi:MAG: hypothetical protein JSV81_18805 [Anaerolineales bacterium]|nr:MAG: hypothetical protein JSV81_18805 [Anaerolineales bacterium]
MRNEQQVAGNWAWKLWQFEETQVRYRENPAPGQASFRYRPGTRPVLISAPHGALHWRQNQWKGEDEYTAALAHVLAEQTGAHALYTVRRIRPDPNFEDDSDYKRTLARLLREQGIELVLDLHGARRRRDFGLELGTMSGTTCPDYQATIIQYLEWQGFVRDHSRSLDRLWVNCLFKGGSRQRTVTRFVWEQCGINAAQIEINAHLRVVRRKSDAVLYREDPDFAADPSRLRRTVQALIRIVRAV